MPSPLRAGLATLLLLGSTAARAQTITLTFPGTPAAIIQNNGPGSCNDNLIVAWTTTGLASSNTCNSLQVWVTNAVSCSDSPGTTGSDGGTDLILGTFNLATSISGTTSPVALSTIPGLVGQDCPNAVIDVKNAICSSVQFRATVGGNCSVISASNLTVRYDTQPPDPPGVSLNAQDSKIIVTLTAQGSQATDITKFHVEYALQPDGGLLPDGGGVNFSSAGDVSASSGQVTITGLINDTAYLVRGTAFDEVNNESAPSDIQSATPLASDGFWATYKKDGGEELGGCTAGGAAMPSVIAAAAVLVAFLRRRR